jgi:hypothetical protein
MRRIRDAAAVHGFHNNLDRTADWNVRGRRRNQLLDPVPARAIFWGKGNKLLKLEERLLTNNQEILEVNIIFKNFFKIYIIVQ